MESWFVRVTRLVHRVAAIGREAIVFYAREGGIGEPRKVDIYAIYQLMFFIRLFHSTYCIE